MFFINLALQINNIKNNGYCTSLISYCCDAWIPNPKIVDTLQVYEDEDSSLFKNIRL